MSETGGFWDWLDDLYWRDHGLTQLAVITCLSLTLIGAVALAFILIHGRLA